MKSAGGWKRRLFSLSGWGLLLVPSLALSASAPSQNESLQTADSPPFIYELAPDNRFAQSSDITILLEKKVPPPGGQEGMDAEPQEDAESSGASESSEEQAGESDDLVDPFEGGAMSAGAGAGGDDADLQFEDLEDPFAPSAEEDIPELKDPFETYNRFMFSVNDNIYEYAMEPVARGWRYVLPEDVRIAIRNVFDNALSPVKLVSSLIQGDLGKSGRVVSRLVINTTLGFGGMLDVAGQEWGIENVNEDMDQALGFHNVPTGPYIVLPFLGPSTGRNAVGRVADAFLSPAYFASAPFLIGAGTTAADQVNSTSFIIDDIASIEESAIDEYESVRDFYHQFRYGLVKK